MTNDFKMDTKKIDKMLFNLRKKMPAAIPKVIYRYVNNMAFRTKKNTEKTLLKFNFSNNSTKKFTMRGIYVQKSKKGSKEQNSEIGATGDIKATTLKARKASYLARQELGGIVTQLKTGGGLRKKLIAPNPAFNKKSKLFRIKGKAAYPKTGLSKRRSVASAFANARANNKKYAFTPYGIYKVFKKSARLLYAYKEKGSIRTPQTKWLQPAVEMTIKRKNAIFRKSMKYEIDKIKP